MKKKLLSLFVVPVIIFGIAGCSSKGGGSTPPPPPPPTEADLVVTLTPPVGSTQPAAPQADFPLAISITSTMPAQGVTIDVSAKKDDGSGAAPFFTFNTSTSGATTNVTITNTPIGVVCLTTVTVTSKSKPANTWTGTYRYSRK